MILYTFFSVSTHPVEPSLNWCVVHGMKCTYATHSMRHARISLIFNESSHFDFGFYCFPIWRWFTQFWYDRWEVFCSSGFVAAEWEKMGASQSIWFPSYHWTKWPLSFCRNAIRPHRKCSPFFSYPYENVCEKVMGLVVSTDGLLHFTWNFTSLTAHHRIVDAYRYIRNKKGENRTWIEL